MVLIGNFGLTVEQSKHQMSIWAILAAPLLLSTDLKNIRPEFREILINRQVIAVNQDPLGIQGLRIRNERKIEVNPSFPRSKLAKFATKIESFLSHCIRHGCVQSLRSSMVCNRLQLHGLANVMMAHHMHL